MLKERKMIAMRLALAAALAAIMAAGGQVESAMADGETGKPASGPAQRAAPRAAPHVDFEEVIRREYQAALAKGTDEALALFIARHPKHKLADQARAKLVRGGQSERPAATDTGPDATVLREFTQATRVDTVPAYDAFIARHPHHPLAAEARRMRADAKPGPKR